MHGIQVPCRSAKPLMIAAGRFAQQAFSHFGQVRSHRLTLGAPVPEETNVVSASGFAASGPGKGSAAAWSGRNVDRVGPTDLLRR